MKRLKNLFMLLVCILVMPVVVFAQSTVEYEDNLNSKGDYFSNKVFVGDNVTNDANVEGLTLIMGNNVKNNGKVEYGFVAGNDITINGEIVRDLFVAGNNITVSEEAIIPRDAYIAGNAVVIKTHVGRNLYVAAATLDIRDVTIDGNVKTDAAEILINENTVINGTLEYEESTTINSETLEKATINDIKTYKAENEEADFKTTVADKVFSAIALYASALVILLVFKKLREKIDKTEINFDLFVKKIVVGLISLIVIPVIAILFMVTSVLLPLSLIMLAIYIILVYLSTAVSSYVVGRLVWNYTKKDHIWAVDLGIGILLISIVSLIPYIGSVVSILAVFHGMGYSFNLIKSNK